MNRGTSIQRFPAGFLQTSLWWAFAGVLTAGLAVNAQTAMAPENWKPLAQPDIGKVLAAAKPLAFEELADGPDSAWVGPEWWVPNPDGQTWSVGLVGRMPDAQVLFHDGDIYAAGHTKFRRIKNLPKSTSGQ